MNYQKADARRKKFKKKEKHKKEKRKVEKDNLNRNTKKRAKAKKRKKQKDNLSFVFFSSFFSQLTFLSHDFWVLTDRKTKQEKANIKKRNWIKK